MDRAQWQAALVELMRSIELQPTQVALFDAAMCLKNLDRYDEAAALLERLLSEYGDQAGAERLGEYRAQLEAVRARMGRLVVTTDVEGAEVLVDGRAVGTTPLAGPILLLPGEHGIVARRGQITTPEEHVTLQSGEVRTVRIALAAGPPAGPRLRAARRSGPAPAWFWISAGVAGLATVATITLGTLALTGDASYDADPDRTLQDQVSGERLVLLTDVSLGIAVASGVVALLLWLATDFRAEEPPSP